MSVNRFRDWSKLNQRIQKESEESPGIWKQTSENSREERRKIQEKWRKAQKVAVGKIRQEETQRKNVRTIFWSLATITVIIASMPSLIRFSQQKLAEIFPPEGEVVKEGKDSQKISKEDLLNELEVLQEQDCLEVENNKCQLEESLSKEQMDKAMTNIYEHRQNLQRAIDISDGKNLSPSQNK